MTAAPARSFAAGGVTSVGPQRLDNTNRGGHSSSFLSEQKSVGVLDPVQAAREQPERWMAWCHACYRSHHELVPVFGISEKSALKLWKGEGGTRSDKVTIAFQEHPEATVHFLLSDNYKIAAE